MSGSMTRPFFAVAGVFALASVLLAASGETTGEDRNGGYRLDRQSVAYRTDVAIVDTNTLADAIALPTFSIGRRPTLAVSARLEASESCTIVVYYLFTGAAADGTSQTDLLLGIDSRTLTATAFLDANGEQVAETALFDTYGATHCKVAVSDLTNPVTLWVGSY